MRHLRLALAKLLAVSLFCLGTWACTSTSSEPIATEFPPAGERPDPQASAADAYWVLRDAIETERINAIYYLLEHTIRDAVDYHTFATAWPNIQDDLKTLFVEAMPVDPPRQLEADPRGLSHGNPCVAIALPSGNASPAVNTLWTLEHDPTRWRGERNPRWRLVYPCFTEGFQQTDEHAFAQVAIDWVAALTSAESNGVDNENNADGNTPSSNDETDNNSGEQNSQTDQNADNNLNLPPGFGD